MVGIIPYYYEHGVFLEDHDGVRMKYRIQKLIYRDQVQSGVIKRIYNLLITQPKVHREAYELNKQPVRWINFKNGYYDPVTGEMLDILVIPTTCWISDTATDFPVPPFPFSVRNF